MVYDRANTPPPCIAIGVIIHIILFLNVIYHLMILMFYVTISVNCEVIMCLYFIIKRMLLAVWNFTLSGQYLFILLFKVIK